MFVFFILFFGVPHVATFNFIFNDYVIASFDYIHTINDGIRTLDLLDVSLLP
jgi:hypothetical protein